MSAEKVMLFFSQWIEKETGIIYGDHNQYQLQDRLEQLAKAMNLSSAVELWQHAQTGITGEFRRRLIDISTNNETSFFRDPKFFESLERDVLPLLISECGGLSKMSIWSTASSTGQEPYSLAMILLKLSAKLKEPAPKILASDISDRVLERARAGQYSEIEINRGLSAEQKRDYFRADINNRWILSPEVRQLVEFQNLNLLTPFSLGRRFHLILCRNVLIYQRLEAKVEIIKKVVKHLHDDGVFLMGSGESLIGLSNEFHQTLVGGVALYRKRKTNAAA